MKSVALISTFFCLCLGLTLDADSSHVTYKGSHPVHSWEGTSTQLVSKLDCSGTGTSQECVLEIEIPIESFDSRNENRDSNMFYYTESLKYPTVKFVSKPFILNYLENTTIPGTLNFHGVEKEMVARAIITHSEGRIIGDTAFGVILSDHDVDRPSLLFVKISDTIELEAHLEFIK